MLLGDLCTYVIINITVYLMLLLLTVFRIKDMFKSSDAPIMIFRGRFRYRFFLSKLADSDFDTDLFSFKQPTRNNERF